MGIKGVYRELGPGTRVSLSKLAADSFETSNRPFRLAIDIAIWQFQNQAARGGTNPAIRTLFYRLVRLLGSPITPIFVFDGPNKPRFKRNKRSGRGDGVATAQAKRLIRLFGFVVHDAPGEAEAECALLQRHGIVDAVLSEDVDTIMFGCTRTLRNWSAEGKSSKSPTHVTMYDVQGMNIADLGLDREGMVLVALMSGGDYLPEGIPGCGVKVACEAAKAGFGKSICRLKASDREGLRRWRESLIYELRTNEKGYFRTRHKALTIPDDFPNLEVLRYYTHPVVSQESTLGAIRQKLDETRDMQLEALREFARETFDWDFRIGAIKFIRVLGQALLVNKLCQGEAEAEKFVKRIAGRRNHFSTDGISELRLAYVPQEVVPIDLSKEVEEDISYGRDGLALNSDDEFDAPSSSVDAPEAEGFRAAPGKVFDVTKPDLAWVLEDVVRQSVPKAFKAWGEAEEAKKRKPTKKKAPATKGKKTGSMPHGALDEFIRITKVPKPTQDASVKAAKGSKAPGKPRNNMAPLKPSTVRRCQTPPPRESCKQPLPMASDNPACAADWTFDSSPETPRSRKLTGGIETIVIPSSPADVAASPAPSPPPSPTRLPDGPGEMPGSIRSILSAGSAPQGVKKAVAKTAPTLKEPQGTKLKQTSIDIFANRYSQPESGRTGFSKGSGLGATAESSQPQGSSAETEDSDPEIICLSGPSSPSVPGKGRERHRAEPERDPSPIPVRKRKILVPSASASGFFDEIEVNADEYEERIALESRLLERRGIRSGVARWSDVSVIDLTGEV